MAPRPLFPPGMMGPAPVQPIAPAAPAGPRPGLAGLLDTLGPQEKQQLISSMLGGASSNLSSLLAQRPNAGIGQILLAVGSGKSAGKAQGLEGIKLGQQQDLQTKQAERQLGLQEAEIQRAEEARQRREQVIARMPPEMRALAEMAEAGVPGQAISAMVPKSPDPSDRYKVVGTDIFDITAEGGPRLAARGSRDAGPLVPIFDPESGQTVYGTRAQAVGQMAPPPKGMRISYDAEGRPIVETGVTGGAGGIEALQKSTAGDIEKQLVQLGGRMERLDLVNQSYKPEFSQIMPRAGAAWAEVKDKFGQLAPAEKQNLQEFSEWKQNAFDDLNQTLRDMSGAAITAAEMDRLTNAAPNPGEGLFDGDSPTEFQTKLQNQVYKSKLAYARLHYYRTQGLPAPDFAGGDNGGTTIDQMPQIIDQRGDEIAKEMQASNPNVPMDEINAAVDQQLRTEFGL